VDFALEPLGSISGIVLETPSGPGSDWVPVTVHDASGAVAAGRLVDARTEAPVTWPASLMVVPVSPRLRAAVAGPEWERAAAEAAATLELRLLPAPAGP
jgi:hypothetical protein